MNFLKQRYKFIVCLFLLSCGLSGQMSAVERQGRRVTLPRINRQMLLREDGINERNKIGGLRFAKRIDVNFNPTNAGETHTTADGRGVWTLNIVSEGAYSLNLFFDKFHLEADDTIFVYNADLSQIFTLTEQDNLQSGSLPLAPIDGDELTVELRQATAVFKSEKLNISRVNHDYRGFRTLPASNDYTDNKDNCSPHATCVPAVSQIKQSVCLLIIDGSWLCSGTLVNNTAQNGKPYILSAAHCFTDEENVFTPGFASTTVVFFNYEVPNCQGNIRGTMEFSIGGANMRAYATDIDFALIELTKSPPVDFRPYYAGWNLSEAPTAPFKGIHHPYGTVRRVATKNGNLVSGTFSGFARDSHWKINQWNEGTTQPGSSGSGLFDASLRLVGALSGGYSECGNNREDYYYRLNKAWDTYSDAGKQLKRWLDPISTGQTTLDGLNPYGNDSAFRITNLAFAEPVEKANLSLPEKGLTVGQNSLGTTEYAEKFSTPETVFLHGFYLVPAKATAIKREQITVRVYSSGNAPATENLLSETPITLTSPLQWNSGSFLSTAKTSFANNDNYIRLPQPIHVGNEFYISYQVPNIAVASDSFAVYTAKNRISGTESVLARQNDTWASLSSLTGLHTAMWIDPVVSYGIDTSVTIGEGNRQKSIIFPNLIKPEKAAFLRIASDRRNASECSISLYNYLGRKIAEKTIYALDNDIPINDLMYSLPTGVYLLRIGFGDKDKKANREILRVMVHNPTVK